MCGLVEKDHIVCVQNEFGIGGQVDAIEFIKVLNNSGPKIDTLC